FYQLGQGNRPVQLPPGSYHPEKVADSLDGTPSQVRDTLRFLQDKSQALPLLQGQILCSLDRCFPDPAARQIDNPPQRDLISRVGDQPQIGEDILNLLALIEPQPAEDAVGEIGTDTLLFKRAGLGI